MKTLIMAVLLLVVHMCAFAYNGVWHDAKSLASVKEIAVLPAEGNDEGTGGTEFIVSELAKRAGNFNFRLVPGTQAPEDFTPESAGADAYLVCTIKENRVQSDVSPATAFYNVRMEAWTDVSGGPQGSGRTEEFTYFADHIVPEKTVNLNIMDTECVLYNAQHEKIMVYRMRNQSYGTDAGGLFKQAVKKFGDELKKAAKQKPALSNVAAGSITLPANTGGDDNLRRILEFTILQEAAKVDALKPAGAKKDYYVDADISRYQLDSVWVNPSIAKSSYVQWVKKRAYRDSAGKEHTYTVTRHNTAIEDYYGYYRFRGNVSGSIYLKEAATGKIIAQYTGSEDGDRTIDAYHDFVRRFFRECRKAMEN